MSNNLTDNNNLFQPTGFRVIIDRTNYANLEFFVQAVNHPGAQCPAVETSFSRIASVPQPGGQMEYGELSFDVLLDEDFKSYTEMYNWLLDTAQIEQVGRGKSDVATGQLRKAPSTYADITVVALTSHNNAGKRIKYVDALPVGVGDLRFEATNQSVEYITFPCSFRFSYFEIQ